MILKHKEIDIPADEPFRNCKLNRLPHAKTLTSVVNTYADGFVLSINNPWGTGKTTFIKMWRAYLEKENFKTIYFNAWENDFDADPLVALMSELKTLTISKADKTFEFLIEKAAVIGLNFIPALAKAVAAKYIDIEVAGNLLENAAKGTTEVLKDEIKDYAKKKQGLVEFRSELEKYVTGHTSAKPLVIFIDEMDRCRPNYAVELLEKVKHFFSVPGIVFVLSIDKVQLGNAVRGFYGSEKINSNEYLRRFIDLEFSLTQPSAGLFSKYLFEYFAFDDFFRNEERRISEELHGDREDFHSFAAILFAHYGLSLRQQEKIFSHARVALNAFSSKNYLFPALYILLIYLKDFHPEFYTRLSDRMTSPQNILKELARIYPTDLDKENLRIFTILEVHLITLYHNHYKEKVYDSSLFEDRDRTKPLIRSGIDKSGENGTFVTYLKVFADRNAGTVKLSHLLNKIDLLDNFQTE